MNDAEELDTDDESLVAYLDGELSRAERDEIENRLVADDSLRVRLQNLQRSWDLLDWLPSPTLNENSVETTLKLVVADLTGSEGSISTKKPVSLDGLASSAERPSARRLRSTPLLWLGVPLVVAAVVFAVSRWNQSRELTRQVADFPIALDMDAYRLSEKPGLIDDLIAAPRWSSVVGGSITPEVDAAVDLTSPTSLYEESGGRIQTPSSSELAARLKDVPAEQRMIALARWDRFDLLDPRSQATLRDSAERLRASDESAMRLETLRRYIRMREQLSDQTVAQIENGTREERMLAIDAAIGEMISSIGRMTRRNLSEDAIERIDFTVLQLVKSRLDEENSKRGKPSPAQQFLDSIPERFRGDNDRHAHRWFALNTLVRDPNWPRRDDRSKSLQDKVPPLNHRELETIRSMLPSKDLQMLQQYVSDPWIQSIILREWATEAVRRKIRGEAKPLSMAEHYESLPPEQRERLDLAPPEEARKILIEGL
ncbi:anti-sigma factor family protein [Allorhodopirellula solitaria]|uniref:Zinc-finger domain-containing protein n=1 Tax=Allorhodopirellula solitaria TaxID=2527987 RepID=A0A5C5YK04_9BACT|nr:hypothetical protein [Allorhodopirellula solitaria]TWT75181.1 hypothetical protein CA85_04700 [Allorhodopirellula solitaria]